MEDHEKLREELKKDDVEFHLRSEKPTNKKYSIQGSPKHERRGIKTRNKKKTEFQN